MIGTSQIAEVKTEAHRFRRALDNALAAGEFAEHPALMTFPTGTCGIVSALLCRYLRDRGLGDWQNVSAVRRSPTTGEWQRTHAWIQRDHIIIDMTADQFVGEGRSSVWVGEADAWYRSWEVVGLNSNGVEESGMNREAYETALQYVRSQ